MTQLVLQDKTAQWLESRKIPVEIAARCGVVTVNGFPAFEYRLGGELQYRKIRFDRNGEKSFVRDKTGVPTCLWGEDEIRLHPDLSSPLVIVEGEIDRLSMIAAGVANVVSVPDGAQLDKLGEGKIIPSDDKAFGWLWDDVGLKPHLAQFNRVVLAVDGDRKGRILREELAVRFERWKCDAVSYPEGCKDANEVLVAYGPEEVLRLVREAVPLVPNHLVSIADIRDTGTGEVFQSGWKGLDDGLHFGLLAPELVIITGKPGSGKSEVAVGLGANLARLHQLPGAILQFEDRTMRVRETLMRYALGNVEGIASTTEARDWIGRWFYTIEPNQDIDQDYDLVWLQATIREARLRHGCRWVLIDPWNEISHIWDRAQTETVYTNDALRRLKKLSRIYGIILMIVVHPSKEGGREKDIEEQDLYGISGSNAWFNKADHGLIIHRPDQSKTEMYLKVAKSKDHILMGKPGIVRMQYEAGSAKFRYVGMGV